MKKVLFIGFEDCVYSQNAFSFTKRSGFDVTCFWAPRERKTKIPQSILEWSGDYIFHLKSYCILPKRVLESVNNFAINFHPSPPQYPGSGGLNRGLYNRDNYTGVTVHLMNEKIDNGQIIDFYKVPIFENDSIKTIVPRVHAKQLEAYCDIVDKISRNDVSLLAPTTDYRWGHHVGRIRDIDKLQKISAEISKEELERIIRATSIGRFRPVINLHGYNFYLKEEE